MLGDVLSAPRFLVDVFSFVVRARFEVGVLVPGSFGGKSSWSRFCICCARVSFAWEIVRDSPTVNFVSQTVNKHIKTLVIGGEVYVAWKCKMLDDVIDGHQEYVTFSGKTYTNGFPFNG